LHELDNFRALTRLLRIECYHLPELDFEGRLQKKKRVSIHICPGGSRAYLKRWPLENWDEIISYVTDLGYEVVLTGSVRDRSLLERWDSWKKVINLAGLSLSGTAEELLSSTVVLSVDTGIMHLAAILGCPLIALHGPTSPKRWGALGKNVCALSPKMNYTPCLSLGFEKRCHKNRCMQAITVNDVKMALEKVLKEGNKDENRASRGRSGQEVMASF
jgi:heptosyltransferase-3